MHMSKWVGYLPVVLMPCCSCQRSEVLLMVILLSPIVSYWWFISFCRCLWLKIWCCCYYCGALGSDAAVVVELLNYHLEMFGVSLRISWSCCWMVLWGWCNEWTKGGGVYVDAGMMVMVEVILLENTIFTWIEVMKWKTIELMEGCMVRSGGDEIYVRQGSLWIFSFLLSCLSHPPSHNNYVFFKTPRLPQRGFHPRYIP